MKGGNFTEAKVKRAANAMVGKRGTGSAIRKAMARCNGLGNLQLIVSSKKGRWKEACQGLGRGTERGKGGRAEGGEASTLINSALDKMQKKNSRTAR